MEEDENQEGSTVTTQITASLPPYGWLTLETVSVGEGRVEKRAKIM